MLKTGFDQPEFISSWVAPDSRGFNAIPTQLETPANATASQLWMFWALHSAANKGIPGKNAHLGEKYQRA